jgi:small nuclear ribonucleoprotein (snRNP)-like protein
MPETYPSKGGKGMWEVRVPAIILAAGLIFGPSLYAQTAPDITLPPGDAARGKAIFEGAKGNCQSCHRVNGVGSLFGPDLSAIAAGPRGGGGGGGAGGGGGGAARGGAAPAAPAPVPTAGTPPAAAPPVPPVPDPARGGGGGNRGGQQQAQGGGAPTPQQLAQSILDPNAVVSVQNRYVVLKMKDGKTITGKLLSIDTFAIQILDSTEKLANISKENVREMTMTSPMPSYREKLSMQEVSDLVSYLTSLKGQ